MNKKEELENAFKELILYIQSAATSPENAADIDTRMLEESTETLCQKAMNSDRETANYLKPSMEKLIAELDALASAMENYNKGGKT